MHARMRGAGLTPSTRTPTSGEMPSTGCPYPAAQGRASVAQQQQQQLKRDAPAFSRQVSSPMANPAPQGHAAAHQHEADHQHSLGDEPTLFALECFYSEGVELFAIPAEDRTLMHSMTSEERFQFPLPPLRVGRGFQAAFFDTVVRDASSRATISREHFQIWAEEAMDRGRPNSGQVDFGFRVRVIIFIANLSGNGTKVNDRCLQARGEQCVLHDGDIITLSRDVPGPEGPSQAKFLQFSFDLSQSCLREASVSELREPWRIRTPGCSAPDPLPLRASSPRLQQRSPPKQIHAPRVDWLQQPPSSQADAMGIGEPDMRATPSMREPAFALKVEGPAVFEHVPDAERVLAFSPPLDDDPSQLYSSMVVGRAHQLEFWESVIDAHAFDTMSRQHFEIQTWRSDSVHSFVVRNLSDVNPIRIQGCAASPAEHDVSLAMARDEQRHLLDGDRIIMNWGQATVFWLTFTDYTRSTLLSFDEDAGLSARMRKW